MTPLQYLIAVGALIGVIVVLALAVVAVHDVLSSPYESAEEERTSEGGKVTRYYFAARYDRHAEMREHRAELLAAVPGAVVTSRWIDCHDGELDASYTPEVLNAKPAECWRHGQVDLEDLASSDAIVSFTGDGGGGKGGRHIEHGVAIAYYDNHPWAGGAEDPFRLIVVGPRENIFHCHPETEVYATFADLLAAESGAP